MTKQKSTKKTLLTSVLSLVLCIVLLIGTTFAWFTDNVTSANNKIVAGNLDVRLLMNTGDGYKDISDSTSPIFGAGSVAQNNNAETLWEPGKTQIAYLAIKNNGNLALKYSVALDVKNVSKNLYEVMEYAITPNAQYDAKPAWNGGNAVVVGKQAVSGTVSLGVGATHYFALSIHMQETAGNEYMNGEVDFDLTVLATQDTVEADSFDNMYDDIALVSDAEGLKTAIAGGKNVMLTGDVAVDADETIAVPADAEIFMDLNGKTLSAYSDKTSGNVELFLVKGEMTVFNGSATIKASVDQNWNAMSTLFTVTAGGVLNIKDATIDNLGGTDMAFGVHLNNWGEVTLNVDNSTIASTYGAIRVFNSGYDMNNVNISNSKLIGKLAVWVHNYIGDLDSSKHTDEAIKERLNFNFLIDNPVDGVVADDTSNLNADANNTFVGKILYGFDTYVTYYHTTKAVVAVSDSALDSAISNGAETVYLASGDYSLPNTSGDVTISGDKDAVITINKPACYNSDVTFDGVTIQASGAHTGIQHVDTVTYNDVTINGEMNLYGEKVVFNGCTFNLAKGQYIWTYGAKEVEFNNCTFNTVGKAILIYKDGGLVDNKVTVKGCTFNATAGDKAGAIKNQNCAAIEIHNYQSNITLVTENNTVDSDFSGEWRIKQYDTTNSCTIAVNGTTYTDEALDGTILNVVNNEVQ